MTKAIITFFLLSGTLLLYGQTKTDQLDSLMKLFSSYGQFNGAILVAEKGDVIYKNAFGFANMVWKIPNTTDTKFKIASLGKQFTALLIMQLVEQGKLNLDGKLSTYLPEYPAEKGDKISIRQLLSHTSGVPNYHVIPDFDLKIHPLTLTSTALLDLIKAQDLLFEPGTQFAYSNFGYALLAMVAEKVSGGVRYSELLKQNIFDKAGMKNTMVENPDTIVEKLANGYRSTFTEYTNEKFRHPSTVFGAGDVTSTVEDFYIYLKALRGYQLLSKANTELLFRPNLEGYGFGWFIAPYIPYGATDTLEVIYHDGGTNGFVSLAAHFPKNEKDVILFANVNPTDIYGILRCVNRILFDAPPLFPKRSYASALAIMIQEDGLTQAIDFNAKQTPQDLEKFNHDLEEFNSLGYSYLGKEMFNEALFIFNLNAAKFPDDANVYDSLAEGYMKSGNKADAIINYKKSLELNPNNTNAKVMLKTLE